MIESATLMARFMLVLKYVWIDVSGGAHLERPGYGGTEGSPGNGAGACAALAHGRVR